MLVITHVSPNQMEITINRFREQFAELSFPFQGQSVSATASFGVAGFFGKELLEFTTLMGKADQMLYDAKRAGRNACRISRPTHSSVTAALAAYHELW